MAARPDQVGPSLAAFYAQPDEDDGPADPRAGEVCPACGDPFHQHAIVCRRCQCPRPSMFPPDGSTVPDWIAAKSQGDHQHANAILPAEMQAPATPAPNSGWAEVEAWVQGDVEQHSVLGQPGPNPITRPAPPRQGLADFMAAIPAAPMSGNTAWAGRYADTVRRVVHSHAEQAPRSQQQHLGPSEIGHECDRQVAGKLAGLPRTNHVIDPWPSVVGTALHAWLDEAFTAENSRIGGQRWFTERRVTPRFTDHPGTADLYDAAEATVADHKCLGETSMAHVRHQSGPPRHYVVQLLTYADGYRRLGAQVDRVALIAYPRTAGSLDGLYVWERPYTMEDEHLLDFVGQQLHYRKQWAAAITRGDAQLEDVPATANESTCVFCPFFRPQSARDGGPGCPGPRTHP